MLDFSASTAKTGYWDSSGLAKAFAWATLAIACFLALFWNGIASLFEAWLRPEYSHGYLIPFIAAALFALKAKELPPSSLDGRDRLIGISLVASGAVVGLFGNLASIPDIITYGMLICIGGFIVSLLGLAGARKVWPAWIYLFFMLPLPNFLYWPLSIKLQFLSSEIGVWLIKLLGIPVFLDGNIIDLGIYKLQVAEACNGLRYLFPLASFGFLFASIYSGANWKKVVLFLSTIPITIGMNSFRIAVIGVLVNSYGIKQAEGFLHFFEGWVIFIACIALLYLEARLLGLIGAGETKDAGRFDINFSGSSAALQSAIGPVPHVRLMGSAMVLLVALGLWMSQAGKSPEPIARQTLAEFPMESDGWTGKRGLLDRDVQKVLGADDYLLADFSSASGAPPVNLLVSYYASQTEGSGVHSPEVCIPAGGWEVSKWGQIAVETSGPLKQTLSVNRAIIQKGQSKQLVYYWFEQRGRRLTSDYLAKAYTVWDSISRKRSDGALVRVVVSIDKAGVEVADRRLSEFLGFALMKLPDFVPP
jgi:exosortase D (VPLPA-CTERM-specific)